MTMRTLFLALSVFLMSSVALATGEGMLTYDSSDVAFNGGNGGNNGGMTNGGMTNGGMTNGGTTNGGTTNGGSTGGGEVGCVRTQGYWGNSPAGEARLIVLIGAGTMSLGNTNYTAAQLDDILDEPVAGNMLINLAHQLIAAKLNVLNGADDSQISDDIATAEGLIGNLVVPPVGTDFVAPASMLGQQMNAVKDELDAYNMGNRNVPSCDD